MNKITVISQLLGTRAAHALKIYAYVNKQQLVTLAELKT